MMRNTFGLVVALMASLATGAVAFAQTSPTSPPGAPAAAPGPMADMGGGDPDYVLDAGDKIRVTVFGEPTLSGEFVVSGKGTLSFPLIGDIQVKGMTVAAAQEQLRARLADGFLRSPRLAAEVLTYRPFYILGEVNRPGQYPYVSGLTVMNAVATAGGFTYRANQKKVLVRGQGDANEHAEALTPSTPVRPGDTIRIKERYF